MLLSDIINYAVYGIVAASTLLGLCLGMIRGLNRQTIRLATVLLSFIGAFLIFNKIFPLFFSLTKGRTAEGLLLKFGIGLPENISSILSYINAEAASYLLAVPMALVILPVSFVFCFLSISVLLWIPGYVFCGAMGFIKRANTLLTRILGGVIGAIQGVFVAAVILLPVAGMIGTGSDVVSEVKARRPESINSVTISSFYETNLAPLQSNIVIKIVDERFGFVYDALTTVRVDGVDVNMTAVATDLYEIFVVSGDLGQFDYTALTEDNKAAISDMIEILTKDEYLAKITAGALSSVFYSIHNGHIVLGLEEPLHGLVISIISVYETEDYTTLHDDLVTTKNVYFIFSDTGSLAVVNMEGNASENMFTAILKTDENGKSTVSLISDELKRNERFYGVADKLSTFAMDILIKNTGGADSDTAQTLQSVKDGLNSAIKIKQDDYETEEEYKAAVSENIGATLEENGISLSDEKLSSLTDKVIENFGDGDEMDDLEFAEFMGKYYDIYASNDLSDYIGGDDSTEVPGESDGSENPDSGSEENPEE